MHTAPHETELSVSRKKAALTQVRLLPPVLSDEDLTRLLALPCVSTHHEDDGHQAIKEKPTALPWVAEKLWPAVVRQVENAWHVDPAMKLYRLEAGRGAVAPHQDCDYDGPGGLVATHSIILFLNEDYEGGETLFEGFLPPAHPKKGGGLLFPHSLMHEGRDVRSGTKFVLKTDLFTLPR